MKKLILLPALLSLLSILSLHADDEPRKLSNLVMTGQLAGLDVEDLKSATIRECRLREVLKGDPNEVSNIIYLVSGRMIETDYYGEKEAVSIFAITNSDMGFMHRYDRNYSDWARPRNSRHNNDFTKRYSFGRNLKIELEYDDEENTARLKAYNPNAILIYFTKTLKKADYDCTLTRQW